MDGFPGFGALDCDRLVSLSPLWKSLIVVAAEFAALKSDGRLAGGFDVSPRMIAAADQLKSEGFQPSQEHLEQCAGYLLGFSGELQKPFYRTGAEK